MYHCTYEFFSHSSSFVFHAGKNILQKSTPHCSVWATLKSICDTLAWNSGRSPFCQDLDDADKWGSAATSCLCLACNSKNKTAKNVHHNFPENFDIFKLLISSNQNTKTFNLQRYKTEKSGKLSHLRSWNQKIFFFSSSSFQLINFQNYMQQISPVAVSCWKSIKYEIWLHINVYKTCSLQYFQPRFNNFLFFQTANHWEVSLDF